MDNSQVSRGQWSGQIFLRPRHALDLEKEMPPFPVARDHHRNSTVNYRGSLGLDPCTNLAPLGGGVRVRCWWAPANCKSPSRFGLCHPILKQRHSYETIRDAGGRTPRSDSQQMGQTSLTLMPKGSLHIPALATNPSGDKD